MSDLKSMSTEELLQLRESLTNQVSFFCRERNIWLSQDNCSQVIERAANVGMLSSEVYSWVKKLPREVVWNVLRSV